MIFLNTNKKETDATAIALHTDRVRLLLGVETKLPSVRLSYRSPSLSVKIMLSSTLLPSVGHALPQRLRVCQLNTLAHCLKDEETDVAFEKRTSNHFHHIASLLPHIIALEEVDSPRNVVLGDDIPQEVDGVDRRVLVRSKTLPMRLAETYPFYKFVHYEKTNATHDCVYLAVDTRYVSIKSAEAFRFQPAASQFALIALVDTKYAGSLLVVAQHAKAGRTSEDESTRIDHSRQLLDFIQSHTDYSKLVEAGRFIWLGDFNAGPHSYDGKYPDEWYRRVIDSTRTPPHLQEKEWSNLDVPVDSATKIALGGEHPFTTFKQKKGDLIKQTIDYIFISHPSKFIKAVSSTVRDDSALPPTGYPTETWGSDHLSVVVELDISQ